MTPEIIKIDNNTEIKIKRYSNGKVESKASYVNAVKHGMEIGWNEDGKKEWEEMWKNGKRDGVETGWHKDGTKECEITTKDNKLHGMNTWWDENGRKKRETHYLWGKKYAQIEWDEEGNVTEVDLPVLPKITKTKSIDKSKKSYHTRD